MLFADVSARSCAVALVTWCSLAAASPESLRPSPDWMPPSSLSPGAAASVERSADRPPRRWGLFATGTTLFAAGYVTDVGVTYGMGHANPGLSLIPILGPL